MREIYRDILGPFPERTPLNVQYAGQIVQEGYTIEKLVYETQPGFYTTANLYRPEGAGPFPAMICPVGHWHAGKAYEDYQALGVGLARSGCIALIYDAPGQGERLTYYDPLLGKSWMGTTVTDEHTMVGYLCFLTGSHLAMYMIWDGMRSIDLLLERGDVDPEYWIARQVYGALASPGKLTVVHTGTAEGPVETVGRWINETMNPNGPCPPAGEGCLSVAKTGRGPAAHRVL